MPRRYRHGRICIYYYNTGSGRVGEVFYSELLGGWRVDDDTITAAMHTFSFFTLFVLVHLFYLLISSNSLSLFLYTLISTHLLEQ